MKKAALRRVGKSKNIRISVYSRDRNRTASTTLRTVKLRTR